MGKTKEHEDAGKLKNRFGVVRVYTRHLSSCKHASEPKHNSCSCPKWIYEHPKGGERKRYSLATPELCGSHDDGPGEVRRIRLGDRGQS